MMTPVWLTIALPLAGAVILLLGGRRTNGWGHLLGCAASLGSFVVGAVLFADMLGREAEHRTVHETLFSLGAGRRLAGGLRHAVGPTVHVLRAVDHRRRLSDPHLFHRLHGRGSRAAKVFRVPEPVPVRDAAAGARRQLPRPLRRLGRRGSRVVPADRVLVAQTVRRHRGQEGVHRQPRRRHRPWPSR